MTGTLALHLYIILSYECFACCCGTIFSIPIFSLVSLEIFCRYYIRMIEKARRVAAFLSWNHQTSLPGIKFALTLHTWTRFFFFSCVACFCCFSTFIFNQKKGGGGRCIFLFPYLTFQISYVFLPDVSVLGA
jgi:hypothetical protein